MGFGLGNFFSDLVGQSNIDAAKKAFENSRFKKSIDDVSDAAGATYKDLSYTANAIGDRYNAAKAAADARVAAEIAADNRGLPTTNQQALVDSTADFLPGAPLFNKGVTAMRGLGGRVLHPGSKAAKQAEGMVQLGKRDLDAVRNMKAIDEGAILTKSDSYDELLKKHMAANDAAVADKLRFLDYKKAEEAAGLNTAARMDNMAARQNIDFAGAGNSNPLEALAQMELKKRMGPNHLRGLQ